MRFILRQITKIKKNFPIFYKKFFEIESNFIDATMSKPNFVPKPKYDGRTKKRQWEERRSDKGEGLDPTKPKITKTDDSSVQNSMDKIKRRKFAILMGYSGTGYYGMQRNPNTKTIEEDLFKALLDCNFINQECYTQVQNMQFQRAARTDKGVSAARQVISLKLGENFEIDKVNEKLSESIRVFAFKRVTKGFNSKTQCDGRTYIYILPTVAFADQSDSTDQKSYRLTDEKLKSINESLKFFEGTKKFHNFTSKKKPNDPSAKRFIRSFTCEAPFIRNGVEFCVMKVYGQSFMMHQIRKMVGLILAIIRGITTNEIFSKVFTDDRVNIPRAPGLGLLLDKVHYERYNQRYGTDGMHETLTWEEVEKDVEEFKEKHILPTIIDEEIKSEVMLNWIQGKLARHSYDDLEEKDESDDEGGDDDAEDAITTKKIEANNENDKKKEEPSS